jgi:hypothetical protein
MQEIGEILAGGLLSLVKAHRRGKGAGRGGSDKKKRRVGIRTQYNVPTESRLMSDAGHEGRDLIVRFRSSGAVYRYLGVPKSVYTRMMRAPSRGRFFLRHIRNKYRFKRIK